MTAFGLPELMQAARLGRGELIAHPIYAELTTLADVARFMECHVFAVWDFMSIVKRLQHELTCVELPWVPVVSAKSARLINEIVVGEESDEDGEGGYASHFDIYRRAMLEVRADTHAVDALIERARDTRTFDPSWVPEPARAFVSSTFRSLETARVHELAAVFTFGREDVIPDMFRAIVHALDAKEQARLKHFRYYLERHIGVDENHHFPLALAMLQELCGSDTTKWREALAAVEGALASRIALWDRTRERLRAARVSEAAGEELRAPLRGVATAEASAK